MYFTATNLSYIYDLYDNKKLDINKFDAWVKKTKSLGFNCIFLYEETLDLLGEVVLDNGMDLMFGFSFCDKVSKICDKNTYIPKPLFDDVLEIDNDMIDFFCNKVRDKIERNTLINRFDKNNVVYINNLGTYLEGTFPITSSYDIYEGTYSKQLELKLYLYEKLKNIAKDFGLNRQGFFAQIIGFNSVSKLKCEISMLDICNLSSDLDKFIYITPVQFCYNSKFTLTNIVHQNSIKKIHRNVDIGWGAMGINGFPVSATTAYFNNVDSIFMATNDVAEESFNRGVKYGYENLEESNLVIIKNVIDAINKRDKDYLLGINRYFTNKLNGFYGSDDHLNLSEIYD